MCEARDRLRGIISFFFSICDSPKGVSSYLSLFDYHMTPTMGHVTYIAWFCGGQTNIDDWLPLVYLASQWHHWLHLNAEFLFAGTVFVWKYFFLVKCLFLVICRVQVNRKYSVLVKYPFLVICRVLRRSANTVYCTSMWLENNENVFESLA